MTPTVGVAIPTFRHERYIAETIESALAQTVRATTIAIVDDCSDDRTAEIARSYERDDLIVIRHESRLGPTRTTHDAVAACDTDFVAVLDGDDVMFPTRIERQLSAFNETGDLRICGFVAQTIDAAGTPLGTFGVPACGLTATDWARGGMLGGGSTLMLRRPVTNHDLRLTWASDWKFVIDNLADGGTSCVLDEVLGQYRQHNTSVSAAHAVQGLRDHVRMCDLLIADHRDRDLRRAFKRQRSIKQCQLGDVLIGEGATLAAARSLLASLIGSHLRTTRDVAAVVHRARRQRNER